MGARIKEQFEILRQIEVAETRYTKYPIKILAPYKLSGSWHWNVLEIEITENKNVQCRRYNTDGYSYPVEPDVFLDIQGAMQDLGLSNVRNIEGQTQHFTKPLQRGVNCGLASAIIFHSLRMGFALNSLIDSMTKD